MLVLVVDRGGERHGEGDWEEFWGGDGEGDGPWKPARRVLCLFRIVL